MGAGMEKVLGIGGMFLPERDPKALARWYREHLGVTPAAGNYDERGLEQQALGFRTLPGDSKYFGDAGKQCMLNFRARDLHAMMAQPERCRNRRGTRSRTLSEWAVRPLIRPGRHCH